MQKIRETSGNSSLEGAEAAGAAILALVVLVVVIVTGKPIFEIKKKRNV